MQIFEMQYCFAFEQNGSIVEVYREDDRAYSKTLSDTAYWHDRFTKTRRNRSGNSLKKGFLQTKS